ncbi:MAG: hypothetical protein ACFE8G_01140 [Candidatus Hermodarchaeota archaeon]
MEKRVVLIYFLGFFNAIFVYTLFTEVGIHIIYDYIDVYLTGIMLTFTLVIMGIFICSTVLILLLKLKVSLIVQIIGYSLYLIRYIFLDYPTPPYITQSNFLITIGNIPLILILIYYSKKLGEYSRKFKIFEKEKIERIMRVSNSIDLDLMREVLGMDENTFQERIIAYTQKYDMRIEGNNLIINKDTLDDFLNSLDEKYKEWGIN